ncbi:MAG: AMP-binding protein [Flavobacteriales bacterium]|nr:AMP-binding protein [Flavobacteriales bacterium]
MSTPFTTLTIDGHALQGEAILPWADKLVKLHNDASWTVEVQDTLRDLCSNDGSISAHTSGTTGPPKAMTLSAMDLRSSARLTGHTFHLRHGDRALVCLPCNFIAGKLMLVRGFVIGLDLHLIDPAGGVLNNLEVDDRFRFAAMVPNQLHRALQDDRARVERQFEIILLGGGPLSQALEEDLQELNVDVYHGYGSTETLTHVALRRLNGPRKQAYFHALGDITFELDERGCLVVHTPHLRTKDHVTNDLVELLDEQRFRWLGRHDNVILSGGKKIYPEQLESRTAGLLPYPHYFMARPDDSLGECVGLMLETEMTAAEVVPEVIDLLRTVLEPYEMPRRVTALDRFPRTPSGKVIRP